MARRLLLTAFALLLAAPAAAVSIEFTRIADATSPGPGWTVNVIYNAPAVDGGVVAFNATDFVTSGTYTGAGGALTTVADSSTPLPHTAGTFGNFIGSPSIAGGTVAFVATDSGGFPNVFASTSGTLGTIAAFGDPEPGGNGNLSISAISPSTDGVKVAFAAADGGGNPGMYTSNGVFLETAADENTSVPGGSGDLFVSQPPVMDAGSVAFTGSTLTTSGIYVSTLGVASTVADLTTPVPEGVGNFVGFNGGPSFDSGNIAFEGVSIDGSGIYAEIDGILERIADNDTLIPGTTEAFDFFLSPGKGVSISDDDVAFYGGNAFGPIGLYLRRNGELVEVVEVGDTLDGKTVNLLRFGSEGLDEDRLAFSAGFTDGTMGVFLASIPEPGTGVLVMGGLSVLAAARRRRSLGSLTA